jgi:3-deoxy-7-phosphoheptulonate synthase
MGIRYRLPGLFPFQARYRQKETPSKESGKQKGNTPAGTGFHIQFRFFLYSFIPGRLSEMLVIQMEKQCSSLDVARVCDLLERRGRETKVVGGGEAPRIVTAGNGEEKEILAGLPGVAGLAATKHPFPLASREIFPSDGVVDIAPGLAIGGGNPVVMAGPCAVESRSQIIETARGVKAAGAKVLRGGAFKPRTNPYSFQGLGNEGIALMVEAREATGLPIVTEVMSTEDIEWLEPHVDIFQIGSRNMMNFSLLKAVGRIDKPVLLKRGLMATVDEWLQAAEYILAGGNSRVILCERGIRSFDKSTRNTLDLSVVPLVKSLSHLPVIVDPSHGTGRRELIRPMSLAALAAGADGLIIEVHPEPDAALSDGFQTLDLAAFEDLMQSISSLTQMMKTDEERRKCALKIAM